MVTTTKKIHKFCKALKLYLQLQKRPGVLKKMTNLEPSNDSAVQTAVFKFWIVGRVSYTDMHYQMQS